MSTEYDPFYDKSGSRLTVSRQHGQLNLWLEPSRDVAQATIYNFRLKPEDFERFQDCITSVETEIAAGW